MSKKETYYVEIIYNDDSTRNFEVTIEGTDSEIHGTLLMVTRGTLMASSGAKAIAYNDQGFDVCSYVR